MRKVILILSIICCNIWSKDSIGEVLIENYWANNMLDFQLIEKNSLESGKVRIYPDSFFVIDDNIIFSEYSTNSIIIFNVKSKEYIKKVIPINKVRFFYNDQFSLFGKTRKKLYKLNLETFNLAEVCSLSPSNRGIITGYLGEKFYFSASTKDEFLTYDSVDGLKSYNISSLYENEGYQYNIHESQFANGYMYSPGIRIKENESNITDKIIRLDYETFDLISITAKENEFGYVLLGIDNLGNIYTSDSWLIDEIRVHDNKGSYLKSIAIDYSSLGTIPNDLLLSSAFLFEPYITANGDVYIMFRLNEGVVVKKFN